MQIAHSRIKRPKRHETNLTEDEQLRLRYEAYQAVCKKYRNEIADIQKYLPGWTPSFPTTK